MIEVTFAGNKKVDAKFDEFVVHTDLSKEMGGDGTALNPFQTFMASIAACSGLFLKGYCDSNDISVEGMKLVQKFEMDKESNITKIISEVYLNDSFPKDKANAVINVVKLCKVKKHLNPNIISEVVLK